MPKLLLQASNRVADARQEVEEIKNELEVLEADLAKKMRARPEDFGFGDKATEAGIKGAIPLTKLHRAATQKYIDAKHQLDLHQGVMWALEAKKKALEMLVQLYGMGYFSDPKVTERGKQAVTHQTMRRLRDRNQGD